MYGEEELLNEFSLGTGSVLEPMIKGINKFEQDIETVSKKVDALDKEVPNNIPVFKKAYSSDKGKTEWETNIKKWATIYLVMPDSLYKPDKIKLKGSDKDSISGQLRAKTIKSSNSMNSKQFKKYLSDTISFASAATIITTYNWICKDMQQMKTNADKLLSEYKDRLKTFKDYLTKWQKVEDEVKKIKNNKYAEVTLQGVKVSPNDALLYLKNLANITREYLSDLSYAYTFMIDLAYKQEEMHSDYLYDGLSREEKDQLISIRIK